MKGTLNDQHFEQQVNLLQLFGEPFTKYKAASP